MELRTKLQGSAPFSWALRGAVKRGLARSQRDSLTKISGGEADCVPWDTSSFDNSPRPAESQSTRLITCLIPEPWFPQPNPVRTPSPGLRRLSRGLACARTAPHLPLEIHILGLCSHFPASASKVFVHFYKRRPGENTLPLLPNILCPPLPSPGT